MNVNPLQDSQNTDEKTTLQKLAETYPHLKHIMLNYNDIPQLKEVLHPIEEAPEFVKAMLNNSVKTNE